MASNYDIYFGIMLQALRTNDYEPLGSFLATSSLARRDMNTAVMEALWMQNARRMTNLQYTIIISFLLKKGVNWPFQHIGMSSTKPFIHSVIWQLHRAGSHRMANKLKDVHIHHRDALRRIEGWSAQESLDYLRSEHFHIDRFDVDTVRLVDRWPRDALPLLPEYLRIRTKMEFTQNAMGSEMTRYEEGQQGDLRLWQELQQELEETHQELEETQRGLEEQRERQQLLEVMQQVQQLRLELEEIQKQLEETQEELEELPPLQPQESEQQLEQQLRELQQWQWEIEQQLERLEQLEMDIRRFNNG